MPLWDKIFENFITFEKPSADLPWHTVNDKIVFVHGELLYRINFLCFLCGKGSSLVAYWLSILGDGGSNLGGGDNFCF